MKMLKSCFFVIIVNKKRVSEVQETFKISDTFYPNREAFLIDNSDLNLPEAKSYMQ